MADDFDDIDNIKDELEKTEAKLFELKEESERQLAELEFQITSIKETADAEWGERMKSMEEMYEAKLKTVVSELDIIRAAFNGDSNGWIAIETPGGLVKYENKATGETTYKEPEVFKIANLFRSVDEADSVRNELEELKKKYKILESKQKESELIINKDRTELKYLRDTEKKWHEASKKISSSLRFTAKAFNDQCDQVLSGLGHISSSGRRIHENIPYFEVMKKYIASLQEKIEKQQSNIIDLHGEVRRLVNDIKEKDSRIETLTVNVDGEVEKKCKPMRDKIAECMVELMKEKATRAQERRELGDLWPKGHLMPTLLMKYRSLSENEIDRRIENAKEANANFAVALEIRSKVAESKMWDLKYDDYGRPYYEHIKTGETQWEEPEIRKYQPPDGRDEMGNIIDGNADVNKRWKELVNEKGELYYHNIDTNEISYKSPYIQRNDEFVKPHEQIVSEAAQLVLQYIKSKISKHIEIMRNIKNSNEILLSPEDRKHKAIEEKNRSRLGFQSTESSLNDLTSNNNESVIEEVDERVNLEELGKFQYDIDTVEMIAWKYDSTVSIKDKKDSNTEKIRDEKRSFLNESIVRVYDINNGYIGPTLYETDVSLLNISQLRYIIENIAKSEEKLEEKLTKTRENLSDFTFLLLKKVNESKLTYNDTFAADVESSVELGQSHISDGKVDRKSVSNAGSKVESSQNSKISTQIKDRTESKLVSPLNSNLENSLISPISTEVVNTIENSKNMTIEIDNTSTISSIESTYVETNLDDTSLIVSDPIIFIQDNSASNIDLLEQRNKLSELSITPETMRICTDILYFTVFCGYINAPMDEIPESISSIIPDDLRDIEYEEEYLNDSKSKDDQWLTASYYLCLTKDRVDIVRQMTSRSFEVSYGLVTTTPLHSENFFKNSIYHQKLEFPSPIIDESLQLSASLHQSSIQMDTSLTNPSVSVGLDIKKVENKSLNVNDFVQIMGSKSAKALATLADDNIDDISQAWLPKIRILDNNIEFHHSLWKSRQLMGEVLRYQLQHESMKMFMNEKLNQNNHANIKNKIKLKKQSIKTSNHPVLNSSMHAMVPTEFDELISLSIGKLVVDGLKHNYWIDHQSVYVLVSICGWVDKTTIKEFSNKPIVWEKKYLGNLSIDISTHKLMTEDIVFEVYNRMNLSSDICIGKCRFNLEKLLTSPVDKDNIFCLSISNSNNQISGQLNVQIELEYNNDSTTSSRKSHISNITRSNSDAEVLNDISNILTQDYSKPVTSEDIANKDILSHHYPYLSDEKMSFTKLVDDIRSEDGQLLKMLSGDIIADDVIQKGYRVNEKIVKKLPTFESAKKYLKYKSIIQSNNIKEINSKIVLLYNNTSKLLQQKLESSNTVYNDTKAKYKMYQDRLDHINLDVIRISNHVQELKLENVKPKEVIFNDLLPLVKIPGIPAIANSQEDKGRQKLTKEYVDDIIGQLERGEMDGRDWFEIFGKYKASPDQRNKIEKAIKKRNDFLKEQRRKEENDRELQLQNYQKELLFYEKEETRRRKELEKAKKDLRKVFIKYDSIRERLLLIESSYKSIELDKQTFDEFNQLNRKSFERYQVMQTKIDLEKQRQIKLIQSLYIKLVNCINNRCNCYNVPKHVKSMSDLSVYLEKSKSYLNTLRYDIFDIKQSLYNEGIRLRTIYQEEVNLNKYELNRLNVLQNITTQRLSIDKIIERNQYEVLHLYESKEKIMLVDAEKDDIGKDTIDDLGERYLSTKQWESKEFLSCTSLINLVLNKVNLIETVSSTASNCQRNILDSIGIKWESDLLSIRDNWVENSDYQRAQQLSNELIKDLNNKLGLLQRFEMDLKTDNQELTYSNQTYKQQLQANQDIYNTECNYLTTTSTNVVAVIQDELTKMKENSINKQKLLEDSITELSREVQEIREQLSTQAIIHEDKMKILWAMIGTQQTTIQNITAKMEILTDEKEKYLIQSRLNFDRLRLQLRQERKFSANLLFIIHSQRGIFKYYQQLLDNVIKYAKERDIQHKSEKSKLRTEIYENIYTLVEICLNPDDLFLFFITRLSNLAGSSKKLNDELSDNNAIMVLSALCKSSRPIIRKHASKALGSIGWDSNIEKRILTWDIISYFKLVKHEKLCLKTDLYNKSLAKFIESGNYNDIIQYNDEVVNHIHNNPLLKSTLSFNDKNLSIRSMIKQKRQYALRYTRFYESPNTKNQRLINMKDGVIQSLLDLCIKEKDTDWEIPRNAALAICIASYEPQNHYEMTKSDLCISLLIQLCGHKDTEVQTHAATTIANLCHNDEYAQLRFGESSAIETLLLMCNSNVVDVLEATTSAIANLTCYCDFNCHVVIENNGISILISLINSPLTVNLFDMDQNDEIQANAAEILANISRYNTELSVEYYNRSVISSIIYMLTSTNIQVRRHAPLVIGNIAQHEQCRENFGILGGVEALFLSLEDNDNGVLTNTLWSLCNLMWHPPNQERAGRYMKEVLLFINHSNEPIRQYASILLANLLYYNNRNRERFLSCKVVQKEVNKAIPFIENQNENELRKIIKVEEGNTDKVVVDKGNDIDMNAESKNSLDLLLDIVIYACYYHSLPNQSNDNKFSYVVNDQLYQSSSSVDIVVLEHTLRSLLSLSYLDYVALALGTTMIPDIKFVKNISNNETIYEARSYVSMFIKLITSPYLSNDVVYYTLGILCNLCVHHINRKLILDYDGTQALVNCTNSSNDHIITISNNILKYLEDITPIEVLMQRRNNIGIENMIAILKDSNDKKDDDNDINKDKKQLVGMTDSLVKAVIAECIGDEIYRNPEKQQYIYKLGGVEILLSIISSENEPIESLLPSLWSLRNLLYNFVPAQQKFYFQDGILILCNILRNCLLGKYVNQVDKIIEACLSCIITGISNNEINSKRLINLGLDIIINIIDNTNININEIKNILLDESIIALAKAILLILGQYNSMLCKNCHKKQEFTGLNCSNCGHRLRVLIDENVNNTITIDRLNDNKIKVSPIKTKDLNINKKIRNNDTINQRIDENKYKRVRTSNSLKRSKTAK